MVTHVGNGVFLGASNVPSQWGVAQRPPNFRTYYMRAHSMKNNNQIICIVVELDVRQVLHGRPRMLTRDLFAVAKFLVDM